MSKRAEELALKIATAIVYADMPHNEIADMIDAELLKERERCAERMTAAYDGHGTIRNLNAMKAAVLKGDE